MTNNETDDRLQLVNLEKIFWQSYSETQNFVTKSKNLIICGMGGSAIAGDYLAMLGSQVNTDSQIVVWRDYDLPAYISNNWIALVISYSGNTEETISMVKELLKKEIEIITMSSGGKLKTISDINNLNHISLPSGFQPRFALPIILGKAYRLFEEILDLEKLSGNIEAQIYKFKSIEDDSTITKISQQLINKKTIIISDQINSPLALRFRCQLNENAKLIVYNYVLPEFNHNGIVGFENKNLADFIVIVIRSPRFEHSRTKIHIDYVCEYLENRGINVHNIASDHDSLILHMLDITKRLDYLSYITAQKQGIDPISVISIDTLKLKLKEN
jgi:glucose/mannose-6-phosphate isomerase